MNVNFPVSTAPGIKKSVTNMDLKAKSDLSNLTGDVDLPPGNTAVHHAVMKDGRLMTFAGLTRYQIGTLSERISSPPVFLLNIHGAFL